MEKREVPRRWTHFVAVGKRVDGTRIIPFKVPLKDNICRKIASYIHFSPTMLIKEHPNLVVIIDLTKYNTYYNKHEFLTKGIDYVKIQCQNTAKLPPTDDTVKVFFEVVDKYTNLLKSDEAVIGVHCVHGVNRTGFLICKYLIMRKGFDPVDAIVKFREARGHGIKKKNYITALLRTKVSKAEIEPSAGIPIKHEDGKKDTTSDGKKKR